DSAGHRSYAQLPKLRSVSTTSARATAGSTHKNVPDWPKCPNVRGELADPVQCGDLVPRISKPSPQSLGRCTPKPGSTPSSPGNCTDVASSCICCDTSRGRSRSTANSARSATVDPAPNPAAAAPPGNAVSDMPSGSHTASWKYSANPMPDSCSIFSASNRNP